MEVIDIAGKEDTNEVFVDICSANIYKYIYYHVDIYVYI